MERLSGSRCIYLLCLLLIVTLTLSMMVKTLNLKKNVHAGGKKYSSTVKKMFAPYPRAWSKKIFFLTAGEGVCEAARARMSTSSSAAPPMCGTMTPPSHYSSTTPRRRDLKTAQLLESPRQRSPSPPSSPDPWPQVRAPHPFPRKCE
jgi:hypothetical protein